ncbi:exocyst subunit EXO70 family protein [Tripterygium wilfordii]|uniref:Exocyst subunit Exo70 family protein n=1 Tax=Tripterygium wilfordii TaxID=458696 RepID=A0A7J7BY59_TRIWF|nr:exocyst complex component EXO70I-like [Tripterygium wilfordii]KAF5726812.1 exocyst subunit EXO70 family protein [Tripterygium wilfordii]
MADVDTIDDLVSARNLLSIGLEKSRAIASALQNTGSRLDVMNQRLPSLEAAFRPNPVAKCAFASLRDRLDGAIDAAAAVLKVYGVICELRNSILSDACSDLSSYLDVVQQIEGALRFLTDNCRLAIQWLQGILEFLECNAIANNHFILTVKKSLEILEELEMAEEHAHLEDGILFDAFDKLVLEFKKLLTENSNSLALVSLSSSTAPPIFPAAATQKLQAVVDRLNAGNWLQNCLSLHAKVRSLVVRRSLEAFDLNYLAKTITEFDNVEEIESDVDQWCKDLVVLVKNVLGIEYKLCKDIFGRSGSNAWVGCFAEIARQSGFLAFLEFGKHVSESNKGPVKLLKLLDIFGVLDNLRVDMNNLFGGEACVEIQTMTRDLIKGIINGACEIFWELPVQVELQRFSPPPTDGSIPKLVCFLTGYCNQLLGNEYEPVLTQVLIINHSWRHEKYQEGLVISQIYNIIKQVALNLDSWSKAYEDVALSCLFMMNNHFHFGSLGGTKVGDMMGESWLKAHKQYMEYYATVYLKETWGKLMATLNPQDSPVLTSPSRMTPFWLSPIRIPAGCAVKKSLKKFNKAFEDLYKKQSKWVVSDESLREKMCEVTVKAFVPVYASYLHNYGVLIKQEAEGGEYVKYTTESVERALNTLFQPKVISICSNNKPVPLIDRVKTIVKIASVKRHWKNQFFV